MTFLFQAGLNLLYVLFLAAGSPWMIWRIATGKNRRGWGQKLLGMPPPGDQTDSTSGGLRLWFHAVSVGEVNLLQPVIEQLLELQPDLTVSISTTTETGFDLARRKYPQYDVFFCPFDFSWAIKRVLKRLQPSGVILAELELWPNLISVCRSKDVPLVVVNGRLGEKSYRGYQRLGWLSRSMFQQISGVAAQDQAIAQRFQDLGCPASQVVVTGSVKFDGVQPEANREMTARLAAEAGVGEDDLVLIAGSTQLEEDLIVAEVYRRLAKRLPNLKVILVPRHPERCPALAKQLETMGVDFQLRSQLSSRSQPRLVVVDVIGELAAWWGRADVAYVGGSMGKREGQNMIEPAAYGVPVSFGPRTRNFRDVVEQLLAEQAAMVVRDADSLEAFVVKVATQPQWAEAMGQRAKIVVERNLGAAKRTAEWLQQRILPPKKRLG